jgi:ketosteroid isomerase-like protein
VSSEHYARQPTFAGLDSAEYCQAKQEERMIMGGMHKVIAVGAVALVTAASAGYANTDRQARATTARALIALENEWAKAVVARDAATFEKMLAPGFVYTENNVVMNRGEVISSMTSGPDRVQFAANEGMKVHDFGTTAVVTGVLVLRGRSKGAAFNRRYRFTDTWMFRNGKWQIIAAQDYLIPNS